MSADAIAPYVSDLFLLTVLAQTHSFTRTAQRLGLSKASVSGRIAELERALGVPLVRRTTRSVSMTQAGQLLINGALPAFEALHDSVQLARDLVGQPQGLVRVSAPVAFGRQYLGPLVSDFLLRYPEISVDLELADRFVNLENEGFDLAIRHTQEAPELYVATPLLESQSYLVASANYVARCGSPRHPHDLADHQCLTYLRPNQATWSFVRPGTRHRAPERVDVAVRSRLKVNNSEVLRDAVIAGLGIGLLPDFSAPASDAGQLVRILPAWRPQGFFGQHVYALRPWSATVPRAVRCFIDHMKIYLPDAVPDSFPSRRRHRSS